MSILLITLFSFLAAMSLIVILFILPMAVQDSPQAQNQASADGNWTTRLRIQGGDSKSPQNFGL